MPLIDAHNDDGEPVKRYRPPLRPGLYDYDSEAVQALKDRRRSYTLAQQEMTGAQKICRDRESARLVKDQTKAFLRLQKAAQLWIDWFETAVDLRFNGWPLELASELDEEINAYELAARG